MPQETPNYALQALLPKDRDSVPMQVLAVEESTVAQVTIGAGNQRVALPASSEVVEVAATDVCRIAFGDGTVDATAGTRRVFPGGAAIYKVPPGATHLAATQVGTSSGFVTVARMF